jgi:hypothetical protein
MITVTHYRNALDPRDRDTREIAAGATLRGLTKDIANQREWPTPTVALVDGKAWMRARWDEALPDGATVEFRSLPHGGGGSATRNLALNIATMGYYQFYQSGNSLIHGDYMGAVTAFTGFWGIGEFIAGRMGKPNVPTYLSGESGSPTYAIGFSQNRKRIGEPIPVLYGRHRLLPDLISQSYVIYENDDQYLYIILCLGIGKFSVDLATLKFGEALFSELTGIQYQFVEPGDSLTLCHDHVSTSAAVNGQIIGGPSAGLTIAKGPMLSFINSGNRINCDSPIFSACGPGDTLTPGNVAASPNNHVFTINTIISSSAIDTLESVGDEFPLGATLTRVPSGGGIPSALINLPPTVTFSASTKRLTSADGAGAFAGVSPYDILTITNTASNNATKTVVSVAPDQSWIQVAESVTNETALNANLVFVHAGWSGWFEVAGPNDAIDDIAVDFIAAKGLGTVGGGGAISSRSITVEVEYQGLNSDGSPYGSATTRTITVTAAQANAVRQTHSWANDTTKPRVRARARRTTAQSTSVNDLDELAWSGLKGILPDVGTYPGVTTLAVIAKATNQLTQGQSSQINLVATRLIPYWDGYSWTESANRSIAWAIADALKNASYGAGLTDAEIDLAALLALDTTFNSRGDYSDAVFDQTTTTWEAIQTIARAGRTIPVLAGGQVTFVRDSTRSLRVAMFTPSNILPGSLRIDYRLPQDGDPDGTSVAWMDTSIWQQAHIDLIDGGGTPTQPRTFDLFGVTSEAQATREATYLDRVRKYQRKLITWQTEMDGHLVSIGDLVALSHDVPAWGQSGDLVAVSGTTYTSSEPLTFTPSATHSVLLRRPDGSVAGPYVVTEIVGHSDQFGLSTTLDFTPRTDLSNGDRTSFQFGANATYTQDVVITSVAPSDSSTVELTAVPYDARIHASGA